MFHPFKNIILLLSNKRTYGCTLNINEKNKDGETALHIATRYNYKETVKFLISHGAEN
ncbi:hypothetical protein TVAG_060390 [Trichomonas vaginalis G3]|uniref:Uncharacterized protein n=1 Tax=Trichomonas vaginalis (strain ATCC PRA-98 / G3) TaxID=412133 RepID=A2ECG8_TRIV3|nr:hypothetical protein TVAG_060390 [Trichomonas vaginalis G3]|eukprot:XP_001321886.1 hypothetical protein [Trichomonas vaginalis G3]